MIEGKGSRNFVRTKAMMYTEPDAWHRLMTKIAESLIGYLNAQIAAGAQALQLFDSWVGCLSPQDFKKYVLPYSRQVVQGLAPGTPVIYFGTETATLLELMKAASAWHAQSAPRSRAGPVACTWICRPSCSPR